MPRNASSPQLLLYADKSTLNLILQPGDFAELTITATLDGTTQKSSLDFVVRPFYREYHQTLTMKLFLG